MPEKRRSELLGELRRELKDMEGVDGDVIESLDQLEANVEDLVNPESESATTAPWMMQLPLRQSLRQVIRLLNRSCVRSSRHLTESEFRLLHRGRASETLCRT